MVSKTYPLESDLTLIRSVQNAFHLVEALVSLGGNANVKQLSAGSKIPLAKTYHLLRTLLHEGYMGRDSKGDYFLTAAWGTLGRKETVPASMSKLMPALRNLRDHTNSQVFLAGYVDGEMEILEYVPAGATGALDLWVDFSEAAHATAIGKSILKHLSMEGREDYLSRHPMQSLTAQTITNRNSLEQEFSSKDFFSFDLQEYSKGVNCLAAPIRTSTFIGAVGIMHQLDTPKSGFDPLITHSLAETVKSISTSLGLSTN